MTRPVAPTRACWPSSWAPNGFTLFPGWARPCHWTPAGKIGVRDERSRLWHNGSVRLGQIAALVADEHLLELLLHVTLRQFHCFLFQGDSFRLLAAHEQDAGERVDDG